MSTLDPRELKAGTAAVISVYLDDQTRLRLGVIARELSRSAEELAEAAVAETCSNYFRNRKDDPGSKSKRKP